MVGCGICSRPPRRAPGALRSRWGNACARVADTYPTPLEAPRGSSPPTRHRRHRPLPVRGRPHRARRRSVARTGHPCRRRARGGQPHGRAPLRSRLRRRLGSARCAVCPRQGAQPLPSALARPDAGRAGAHAVVTPARRRAPPRRRSRRWLIRLARARRRRCPTGRRPCGRLPRPRRTTWRGTLTAPAGPPRRAPRARPPHRPGRRAI